MSIGVKSPKPLKKELKLAGVYAIATGATLSAGFFLLPGLAAIEAGPALVLSYMIAAAPLIPAMFSIIELATAMPRAGGVYYFLDRTLGPLFGAIGGIGTWLTLLLKVSFALIGMGAYIKLFIPEAPMVPIAIGLAVALGLLNYFGAKKTGNFQIFLVIGLLAILTAFICGGVPKIDLRNLDGFFDAGFSSIIATAGLVYISYVGITNIASLSEEIKDPEKNLPRGVILSLATAFVIYGLGTLIMVGVVPMEQLAGSLTPVAAAAKILFGDYGVVILSVGALIAFVSVANAGTMSASRYPLAMSRDHILPRFFLRLGKRGTPYNSIFVTVSIVIIIVIFLDPIGIAKLASAFQLFMFALVCLAVIVIRESRIESYDPGYKSPLYPYMQIFGFLSSICLIIVMGWLPSLFSLGLALAGALWYFYYARDKVVRTGAIYHIFERLGRSRYEGLDPELRGILKEKGLREKDPFDEIVARSFVIDVKKTMKFEDIVDEAAKWLSQSIPMSRGAIKKQFLDGTRIGATPVTHGIALPHFRTSGVEQAEMTLVRAKKGVYISFNNPLKDFKEDAEKVYGIFFLVSPESNPTQHLRILAQLAERVDEESFLDDWYKAKNEQKIKEALLRDERFLSLRLIQGSRAGSLIGKMLKTVDIPDGCLVAMLRRSGKTIIPKGDMLFQEGDRLTIIGDVKGLTELRNKFAPEEDEV